MSLVIDDTSHYSKLGFETLEENEEYFGAKFEDYGAEILPVVESVTGDRVNMRDWWYKRYPSKSRQRK